MLLGCRLLSNVSRKFPGQPLFCNFRNFSKERAGKSVRPGCAIILDGQPHKCVKMIQGKRGKGGGFVKATLKNLISGNTYEKTFTSDEIVEHAELERKTASFSWSDENNYIFMDLETFEEIILPKEEVELGDFLTPGLEVRLSSYAFFVLTVTGNRQEDNHRNIMRSNVGDSNLFSVL